MAKTLSKTGIATSGTITAAHVTQSIDALTGGDAYNVTISGSTVLEGPLTINLAPVTNLTASGHISASGTITSNLITTNTITNVNTTHITASGNISSSGIGTFASLDISGDIDVDGTTNLDVVDIDGAVDMASTLVVASHITASGNISASGNILTTHITASGNITSSGNILAGNVFLPSNGKISFDNTQNGTDQFITGVDNQIVIDGDDLIIFKADSGGYEFRDTSNAATVHITTAGTITASGNISSSGDIIANNLTLSGDIISVGDDVTITDDLIVGGNISGSGEVIGRKTFLNQRNLSPTNLTLTATQCSNGLVSVNQGNNNAMNFTLPTPDTGLEVTFVAKITSVASQVTTISAPSAVLNGIAICDDGTEDIVGTNFIFASTKFIKGTRVNCISDGTNWYITAFCLCTVGDVSTT